MFDEHCEENTRAPSMFVQLQHLAIMCVAQHFYNYEHSFRLTMFEMGTKVFHLYIFYFFLQLQHLAITCVQRNIKKYVAIREWPWWRLYTKIQPLLDVHRTEEELKEREVRGRGGRGRGREGGWPAGHGGGSTRRYNHYWTYTGQRKNWRRGR